MDTFPREIASRSMISSVFIGSPVTYSSACTSAIVRLIPHADPIRPHDAMNRSCASRSNAAAWATFAGSIAPKKRKKPCPKYRMNRPGVQGDFRKD